VLQDPRIVISPAGISREFQFVSKRPDPLISRRKFLQLFAAMAASGVVSSAYAVVIEPFYRLRIKRYRLTPPNWPAGLPIFTPACPG